LVARGGSLTATGVDLRRRRNRSRLTEPEPESEPRAPHRRLGRASLGGTNGFAAQRRYARSGCGLDTVCPFERTTIGMVAGTLAGKITTSRPGLLDTTRPTVGPTVTCGCPTKPLPVIVTSTPCGTPRATTLAMVGAVSTSKRRPAEDPCESRTVSTSPRRAFWGITTSMKPRPAPTRWSAIGPKYTVASGPKLEPVRRT